MTGRIVGTGEKTRYLLDGKEVSKAEFDLAFPDKPGIPGAETSWDRPVLSDGAAVHPRSIQKAMAHAQKIGVPVEFLPDGRAKFTSRRQRAAYLKAIGMKDNDGGYGDG